MANDGKPVRRAHPEQRDVRTEQDPDVLQAAIEALARWQLSTERADTVLKER